MISVAADPFALASPAEVCVDCLAHLVLPLLGGRSFRCPCGTTWPAHPRTVR